MGTTSYLAGAFVCSSVLQSNGTHTNFIINENLPIPCLMAES